MGTPLLTQVVVFHLSKYTTFYRCSAQAPTVPLQQPIIICNHVYGSHLSSLENGIQLDAREGDKLQHLFQARMPSSQTPPTTLSLHNTLTVAGHHVKNVENGTCNISLPRHSCCQVKSSVWQSLSIGNERVVPC